MIFITGATGNIGRQVINELIRLGEPVRAAVINQNDAELVPEGVDIAIFDFTDPATYQTALEGAKKVFLMRPPQITDMDTTLNPFVDYAKSVGIRHIGFVSLFPYRGILSYYEQ